MRRAYAVAHTAHTRLNALRSTSLASVGGFQRVASATAVRAFARASGGTMGRFADVPEAPKVRACARVVVVVVVIVIVIVIVRATRVGVVAVWSARGERVRRRRRGTL
jgi:hypothetical protein